MAVTITEPTTNYNWIPSCNPIIYTISTTTTSSKLSYIIDVQINGNNVTRLKYPVYNRSELNVNLTTIVNDYLEDTFCNDDVIDNLTYFPTDMVNEVCSLQITVTEEYYDSVQHTVIVDTPNAVTSDMVFAWRAAAPFEASRNIADFQQRFTPTATNRNAKFLGTHIDPITSGEWMLDANGNGNPNFFRECYDVSFDTHRTISMFNLWDFSVVYWNRMQWYEIFTFDKNLVLNKQFYWEDQSSQYPLTDYTKKIWQFQVGLNDLNNYPNGSLVPQYVRPGFHSYFDPIEDAYYVVDVDNCIAPMMGGIRAIPFRVVPCSKYKVYNILYKTTEGGWWQIRCTMKHHNETEVKTSVKYNTWGLSAQEIMPNNKRFKETMHTEANGTITLNTDWITSQGIVKEIEDMIISPQLYLVTEDAVPQYIPVVLKDTTYDIMDKGQDRMFQYEFEFEEAYKKNTLL